MSNEITKFSILKGNIIRFIDRKKDNDELIFHLMDGRKFKMYHITIRWCGTSNGYYSIAVDFEEI